MNFTFGIITVFGNEHYVSGVITSIRKLNIPNYDIVVVGGPEIVGDDIIHIPFDEHEKHMWITRKKNIITKKAKYSNIVYLHDYVSFEQDWYHGYLKFGDDFQISMNIIKNQNGERFRDWCLWDANIINNSGPCLIPYNIKELSKHMYISGSYWVAKKHVMEEYPLDENLSWGQSEDVEWSKRVTCKYSFSMNEHSTNVLLKQKDVCLPTL